MIFHANNIDLFHFEMEAVSYPPKKINTMALLVTPENIGALSLEFEVQLQYKKSDEAPFFWASVERHTDDKKWTTLVCIEVGHNIVFLWDEIHVFHENEFNNTFREGHDGTSEQLVPETPGGFGIASGEVTGPDGTQLIPAVNA